MQHPALQGVAFSLSFHLHKKDKNTLLCNHEKCDTIYAVFRKEVGRLAQLVRALPSHGRGHWSESSGAHHFARACKNPVKILLGGAIIQENNDE